MNKQGAKCANAGTTPRWGAMHMDQSTRPKHFLISIATGAGVHMHAYQMCAGKNCLEIAASQMLDSLEKHGLKPLFGIVLATRLSKEVATVRAIASARNAEIARLIQEATDYHFSAWFEPADSADDVRLMAIH
jgi:hypothetical protein